MSSFPLETWENIFYFLNPTSFTESDVDSWKRNVRDDKQYGDFSKDVLEEYMRSIRVLGLVSKSFRSLLKAVQMENVMLLSGDEIEDFARTLRKDARVAEMARRRTRRIDVVLLGSQDSKGKMYPLEYAFKNRQTGLFRQIHKHLGTIFNACPNLMYLTIRTDDRFFIDSKAICTTFSNISPSLEVLRWDFDYPWGYHDDSRLSLLPDLRHLQVLDFSGLKEVQAWGVPQEAIKEFPHLHTFIGPVVFICYVLAKSTVPSLRTFVCTSSSHRGDPSEYGNRHPFNQITTLNVIEPEPASYLCSMFREATDIVLRASAVARVPGRWRSLTTLGIAKDDEVRNPRALRDLLSKREGDHYTRLRTVRLLHHEASEPLRISDDVRARLQKWTINIEDDAGNIIFPVSSKFKKGMEHE